MKSTEYLSLLRTVIREEVTKVVRKELSTLVTENAKYTAPAVEQPIHRPVQQKVPTKKPMFKNPILNELLGNVGTVVPEYNDSYEEWPTMNYGDARYGNPASSYGAGVINAAPEGTSLAAIQSTAPEVANALTRDYRELVKAFDKKK